MSVTNELPSVIPIDHTSTEPVPSTEIKIEIESKSACGEPVNIIDPLANKLEVIAPANEAFGGDGVVKELPHRESATTQLRGSTRINEKSNINTPKSSAQNRASSRARSADSSSIEDYRQRNSKTVTVQQCSTTSVHQQRRSSSNSPSQYELRKRRSSTELYSTDEQREKSRLRRESSHSYSPSQSKSRRRRTFIADKNDYSSKLVNDRPRPNRSTSNPSNHNQLKRHRSPMPYFADEVREKDRLRRLKHRLSRSPSLTGSNTSPPPRTKLYRTQVAHTSRRYRSPNRHSRSPRLPENVYSRRERTERRLHDVDNYHNTLRTLRTDRRRASRSRTRSRSNERNRYRERLHDRAHDGSEDRYYDDIYERVRESHRERERDRRRSSPKIITIPIPVPASYAYPSYSAWPTAQPNWYDAAAAQQQHYSLHHQSMRPESSYYSYNVMPYRPRPPPPPRYLQGSAMYNPRRIYPQQRYHSNYPARIPAPMNPRFRN